MFEIVNEPGQTIKLASSVNHQAVCQAFEKLLRQQLDPEAVDLQAKADQDRLIEKFGGVRML